MKRIMMREPVVGQTQVTYAKEEVLDALSDVLVDNDTLL